MPTILLSCFDPIFFQYCSDNIRLLLRQLWRSIADRHPREIFLFRQLYDTQDNLSTITTSDDINSIVNNLSLAHLIPGQVQPTAAAVAGVNVRMLLSKLASVLSSLAQSPQRFSNTQIIVLLDTAVLSQLSITPAHISQHVLAASPFAAQYAQAQPLTAQKLQERLSSIELNSVIKCKLHCICLENQLLQRGVHQLTGAVPVAISPDFRRLLSNFFRSFGSKGSFQYVDYIPPNGQAYQGLEQRIKGIADALVDEFYRAYRGYVAFGHLSQSIELFPDPYLTLWDQALEKSGQQQQPISQMLSIVGFIPAAQISAAICLSKHAILESTEKAVNDKAEYKRQKKQLVAMTGTKKLMEADAVAATAASGKDSKDISFCELLCHSLIDGEKTNCAIVELGNSRYGYISVAKDAQGSCALVLNVLATTESAEEDDGTSAYPWLRANLASMIERSVEDDFDAGSQFQSDSMFDNTMPRTYTDAVAGTPLPLFESETLQGDFQRVFKAAKSLPNKNSVFVSECERIRKMSSIYMNDRLRQGLISFLNGLAIENKAGTLPSAAVRIMQDVISQLEANGNKPLVVAAE